LETLVDRDGVGDVVEGLTEFGIKQLVYLVWIADGSQQRGHAVRNVEKPVTDKPSLFKPSPLDFMSLK